jgi:hypothetical protein
VKPPTRTFVALLTFSIIVAVITSCGSGTSATGEFGYRLPFLPFTLAIDTNGNISIHGDASIVTPLGTFSVDANVSKGLAQVPDATLLIIRHKKNGFTVDDVFRIGNEEIVVTINGLVTLTATNGRVFVDATKAHVQSIEVRSAAAKSSSPQPVTAALPFTDPLTSARHAQGWPEGPYYPPSSGVAQGEPIYCGFEPDGLRVGPGGVNNPADCNNASLNIGDADISITATLTSDDRSARAARYAADGGFGIFIRIGGWAPVGFTIRPDGTWSDQGQYMSIDHPATSAILGGLGVSNTLRIRAIGSRFEYFVNGVEIGDQTADWAAASGGVELVADEYDSVVFKNLVVKAPQ